MGERRRRTRWSVAIRVRRRPVARAGVLGSRGADLTRDLFRGTPWGRGRSVGLCPSPSPDRELQIAPGGRYLARRLEPWEPRALAFVQVVARERRPGGRWQCVERATGRLRELGVGEVYRDPDAP